MNTHNPKRMAASEKELEWLLPFANGGYASSTATGCNTRSYHGLLVAGLPKPWDRIVYLSHMDVNLHFEVGRSLSLASHLYGDHVNHPGGERYLASFTSSPWPSWHWQGDDFDFWLSLIHLGGNSIKLVYKIDSGQVSRVEFRPFVAGRAHHGGIRPSLNTFHNSTSVRIKFDDLEPELLIEHGLIVDQTNFQHDNFLYKMEESRGLSAHEDLQSPFGLNWTINHSQMETAISLKVDCALGAPVERQPVSARTLSDHGTDRLKQAARDFLIKNPDSGNPGIIAGYPWFNEWGRDTMISLPGVAHASGDPQIEEAILLAWAKELKNGLLPNRLAEGAGEQFYNSVDAPLWFIKATTRSWSQIKNKKVLLDGIVQVIDHYLEGTLYAISVDEADGLLRAGTDETQLTWMDACHEGKCFTPRFGKCVELNALFHHALSFAASQDLDSIRLALYTKRANQLRDSFLRKFADDEVGLKDCLEDHAPRLRPNQLFALATPSLSIPQELGERALGKIEEWLLTPFGLRTLAPNDLDYIGCYEGGPANRDRAYHQGTTWMWLMGAYFDAQFQIRGTTPQTKRRAEDRIAVCLGNLNTGCVDHLNEIFDGDAPHCEKGAPAQAWSAAELLRVIEDWNLDKERINLVYEEMNPRVL